MFGNPETTTGGRALKFYASVRIDIRRIASIKDGDQVIGGRTRVKVVKNKVAPPFREAEFDVMYGEGISREGDLLDLAVEKRIVEKSGAWFAYGGERLGQGRENAKQFLKENPSVRQAIEDRVRHELGMVRDVVEVAAARLRCSLLTGNLVEADLRVGLLISAALFLAFAVLRAGDFPDFLGRRKPELFLVPRVRSAWIFSPLISCMGHRRGKTSARYAAPELHPEFALASYGSVSS